jgi:hypothetical protein
MINIEDFPMALVQLLNELSKVGFHADYNGFEITIRKIREPLLNELLRMR